MSSSMQQAQQVEWRRAKVLELMSKGETNQSEIARILQVGRSTICRDVEYLRQRAKENITSYVDNISCFVLLYIMYKIAKTKMFAVSAAIPILMLLLPNVYAGGAREDWDERYTSIPGAPECWVDGYDDVQDNPFSQDRHRGCIFDIDDEIEVASDNELCCNGKPYYEGFMYGCMDVKGNTEEDCERATD